MKTDLEKVKKLAKDLRKGYPRSPREKLRLCNRGSMCG